MKRFTISLIILIFVCTLAEAQAESGPVSENTDTLSVKEKPGSLYITSKPSGMSVLRDGEIYYGKTPLLLKNLDPGTYAFKIDDHTKIYSASQISVDVEPGKKTSESVKLDPNYITFKISTEERTDSVLYINGRPYGELPYSGKLPFQQFHYRIVPEDKSLRTDEGIIIPSDIGITVRRRISILEEKGTIAVISDPEISGTLYVNEIPAGTFPGEFSLYTGEQTLRVEGYYEGKIYSGETIIKIRKDQFTDVIIELEPAEG